jgi:hypothetical protein
MDAIGRPNVAGDEDFFRDPVLSIKKALAEGTPTETLVVLGWFLDTRRLLIQLPADKRMAWLLDVEAMLEKKKASYKALNSLIGRLQHVAAIIPTSRHFLGRLRTALAIAMLHGGCNLPNQVLSDLKLWLRYINYAAKGVSLNLLTFRLPNNIIRVDACPWGVGGYSLTTGRAWFIIIPPHLRGRAHINWLEFAAAHIGTLLEITWGKPAKDSCFMAIGDNTTASHWIHKSNFADTDDNVEHMKLARDHASLLLKYQLCIFSQWLSGDSNGVADALSRAAKLGFNAAQLTHYIRTHYATQIPKTFRILEVPEPVASDLFSRLLRMTVKEPLHQRPLIPTTFTGADGSNSSTQSWTTGPMTRSYAASIQMNESNSSKPLGPQFDMDTSPHETVCTWLRTHLKLPPQHMWHRPSGFPFASMAK